LCGADIQEKFAHIRNPNVFPFQRFIETEKAGYLIRQYFLYNLYDRIGYPHHHHPPP
jgi:phosphoinositide-3-kinase regulatory subunit 4